METYCRYHPIDHAGWHCLGCHEHFCDTCVPAKGVASATCPRCHAYLRYTGAASQVTPFWQCLSDFFLYPFAFAPLCLMAICTIFPALAGDGLIGLIVAVFLFCAQTKYIYTVVESTAYGELSPPALSAAFAGGGIVLVVQQVFILLTIVGVTYLTSNWLGDGWAIVVVGLVLLLLPASVMILATEHEVSQALDLTRLAGLIRTLGWPYFVMYGYIVLLLLGMGAAQSFALENFRPAVAYTITGFVASYFLLVIFNMMGYVLFQYQHLLGAALVADSSGSLAEKAVLTEKHTQTEIDIALKEGNYDLAITSLINQFNRKAHDKVTLNRLFRLLMETQQWEPLDKKSRPVLALLLETGRIKEIRQMLRGLYKQRPDFEVRDPDLAWHLAQSLYHAGEYRLLLRILKDFGHRFKGAPQEAEVIELSARTLANGLHNNPKAKLYLHYLQKHFPDHPLADGVPAQLEQLETTGHLIERRVNFT